MDEPTVGVDPLLRYGTPIKELSKVDNKQYTTCHHTVVPHTYSYVHCKKC
jgi:hypothetical protein